jgi:hypothetical protein
MKYCESERSEFVMEKRIALSEPQQEDEHLARATTEANEGGLVL